MKTYAFVDASNLFYGGEKSLGWTIDYQKLLTYLKDKYQVERTLYFGGIDRPPPQACPILQKIGGV